MSLPLPSWLEDASLSDAERAVMLKRFRLRVAALYATPSGTLMALGYALGCNQHYITVECNSDKPLPRYKALAVRGLVGPEVFPLDGESEPSAQSM